MLPPLIHIICSSLLLSNLIENTPPAAIVCHPPPPSGGATRSSSLFDCCVIVMVWWFVCPRPRGDACSKEPPLFNYCNSVGNCRQGRSNHTHNRPGRTCGNNTVDNCRWCCNIGNREETFVRRGEGIHIHVAAGDLVRRHSQAFWETYLACAGHRPTSYPPPRAGLSTVPTFTISWHSSAEYGRRW